MKYYPINLNIENQNCLVVGGGLVGSRKVLTLLECGAKVTVVSPVACDQIEKLAAENMITWIKRAYQPSDLEQMFLVIGASDKEDLNEKISMDAKSKQILCNIVDRPLACNFIVPSVIRRGDLVIAISTSGTSPLFARVLRERLEDEFGEEYAQFLELMGSIREKLLSQNKDLQSHRHIFDRLIEKNLFNLVKLKDKKGIELLLGEVLGKDFTLTF